MLAVFKEPLLYISMHMQAPIKAITHTYNTHQQVPLHRQLAPFYSEQLLCIQIVPFYSERSILPHARFDPPPAQTASQLNVKN